MALETVKCPNCGFAIEVSAAVTASIREQLRSEFEADAKKRERALSQLKTKLDEKEQQLSREKQSIDEQISERVKEQLAKVRAEAEQAAAERLTVELEDAKARIQDKDKKIAEAHKIELELRKKARELEERQGELELEVARKVDSEREKIRQDALKAFAEEHRLKDLEREKVIQDLRKALEDAKRKAEQGSMQTQGEVLELDLESQLASSFPFDQIEPVPKGIRGADVIQRVFDSTHKACGVILWESKHTKNWSDSWIQKLKDDQRAIGGDIAVIVTEAMPKDLDNFGLVDGVWVTSAGAAMGLGTALRHHLIDVAFARRASEGKSEKMEALYGYLSGPEFRQKVEAIVETFTTMQTQLEKEKRAMMRIWNEREKQIQRIVTNTVGMYGDMRGIIGASLPEIRSLELDAEENIKQLSADIGDED
jgi:hypothetical protein